MLSRRAFLGGTTTELAANATDGQSRRQFLKSAAALSVATVAPVGAQGAWIAGSDTIRVINDHFEATGSNWSYAHKDKKVSIGKNVRVILHTQLNSILQ